MGKIGAYEPREKYKNYLLPTGKPLKSHAFYKEKVPNFARTDIFKTQNKSQNFLKIYIQT